MVQVTEWPLAGQGQSVAGCFVVRVDRATAVGNHKLAFAVVRRSQNRAASRGFYTIKQRRDSVLVEVVSEFRSYTGYFPLEQIHRHSQVFERSHTLTELATWTSNVPAA